MILCFPIQKQVHHHRRNQQAPLIHQQVTVVAQIQVATPADLIITVSIRIIILQLFEPMLEKKIILYYFPTLVIFNIYFLLMVAIEIHRQP